MRRRFLIGEDNSKRLWEAGRRPGLWMRSRVSQPLLHYLVAADGAFVFAGLTDEPADPLMPAGVPAPVFALGAASLVPTHHQMPRPINTTTMMPMIHPPPALLDTIRGWRSGPSVDIAASSLLSPFGANSAAMAIVPAQRVSGSQHTREKVRCCFTAGHSDAMIE